MGGVMLRESKHELTFDKADSVGKGKFGWQKRIRLGNFSRTFESIRR
jgi:hypothetical protein